VAASQCCCLNDEKPAENPLEGSNGGIYSCCRTTAAFSPWLRMVGGGSMAMEAFVQRWILNFVSYSLIFCPFLRLFPSIRPVKIGLSYLFVLVFGLFNQKSKFCVILLYALLSFLPVLLLKIKVCLFFLLHPALTPIWLEKWVFSVCGAESVVCNMKMYKQLSLPPVPPQGGSRGGLGGPRPGGVGRVLFLNPYTRSRQK
jgi:hypothetical protein